MGPFVFFCVVLCCIVLLGKIHSETKNIPPSNNYYVGSSGISSKRVESSNEFCALCKCKTNDLCGKCKTKVCYECAAELNNDKCPTCTSVHKKVCKHDFVNLHYHSFSQYRTINIEEYMIDYFPGNWKTCFGVVGGSLTRNGTEVKAHRTIMDADDQICVECGEKKLKYTNVVVALINETLESRRKRKLALEMIYKGKNES